VGISEAGLAHDDAEGEAMLTVVQNLTPHRKMTVLTICLYKQMITAKGLSPKCHETGLKTLYEWSFSAPGTYSVRTDDLTLLCPFKHENICLYKQTLTPLDQPFNPTAPPNPAAKPPGTHHSAVHRSR